MPDRLDRKKPGQGSDRRAMRRQGVGQGATPARRPRPASQHAPALEPAHLQTHSLHTHLQTHPLHTHLQTHPPAHPPTNPTIAHPPAHPPFFHRKRSHASLLGARMVTPAGGRGTQGVNTQEGVNTQAQRSVHAVWLGWLGWLGVLGDGSRAGTGIAVPTAEMYPSFPLQFAAPNPPSASRAWPFSFLAGAPPALGSCTLPHQSKGRAACRKTPPDQCPGAAAIGCRRRGRP